MIYLMWKSLAYMAVCKNYGSTKDTHTILITQLHLIFPKPVSDGMKLETLSFDGWALIVNSGATRKKWSYSKSNSLFSAVCNHSGICQSGSIPNRAFGEVFSLQIFLQGDGGWGLG